MILSEQKKALIEKIGIFYEKLGMQPAAGRIMGLMFVSDRPELTFDEIRELLNISKSATSTALNLLIETGPVEYITFAGDRKRYFKLKTSNWRDALAQRFNNIISFKTLLQEVMETRSDKSTEFNSCLEEFIDFLEYLQQELPSLLKKWEESRK
ncbi:DNA-binding transcriptional regulator GbsR (MarR family) [Pontibacter aydingkolensis]|uniref:MarR family transcriptional regulator n=1 Tax=Pontibacter aydingkolensis TaxID=1911536 RepID=A0ABS7CS61_9BACT|nr:MarR family transcriptional regulator [Pontibacter aydingkolensis]MBW7466691.1 MarR family transcriptional regulator [Pontibacter aydingkolensis]